MRVLLLLAACEAPAAAGTAPPLPQALDCGTAGEAGGLGEGHNPSLLLRQDVDLKAFPEALCNDGTGAVFYVRRGGDSNRWVIQLEGGGSCADAQSCADRWCSVGTNFGMQSMSATPRTGVDGNGIFAHDDEHTANPGTNPLASYNQVIIQYCSSDAWVGHARDVDLDALHPLTGAPVRYRIHFEGAAIFDAVISTLRGGGVQGMPDLDGAQEIVLAGASAGGAGVAHNLDRLLGQLTPMGAPPLVRGLIDSAFTPSLDQWDLSASLDCTSRGLCNFKDVLNDQRAHSLWKQRFDDSCIAFHPMDDWLCFDGPHVLTHHVTTPFFVRQGLDDQLLSQNAIDAGYQVPGQGTLTVRQWGMLVRQNLLALAGIDANTEEKPAAVPGAFGPLCNKHDTLGSNADIFGVTIAGAAMFDVWTKWVNGAAVQTVSSRAGDTVCPP